MESTHKQHTSMIHLLNFITGKYGIPGFISGLTMVLITRMHFLFTDENLKAIGGLGLMLSGCVAGLTMITLSLKLFDDVALRVSRYRNRKKKKY